MISSFPLRRFLATSALGISMALFGNIALQAQTTASPPDYAAAAAATNVSRHALRAMTPAGQAMSAAALHTASTPLTSAVVPPDSGGPRYPADLEYLGGAVVVSMESHAIYLFAKGGLVRRLPVVGGIHKAFYGTTAKAT